MSEPPPVVAAAPPVVPRAAPSLARRVARSAWRAGVHALACCGALSIAYHALFELARMSTSSMAPLLVGEDRSPEPDTILVETCFTSGAAPRRFQVVAFRHELGMIVAKRVVGLPGESIAVTPDGRLLVDGVTIDAPPGAGRGRGYIACGNLHRSRAPFVVPPGQVYLLGDDSQDSDDSRFWGGLPIERIAGRVLARVWPPSRMAPL